MFFHFHKTIKTKDLLYKFLYEKNERKQNEGNLISSPFQIVLKEKTFFLNVKSKHTFLKVL